MDFPSRNREDNQEMTSGWGENVDAPAVYFMQFYENDTGRWS